MTTATAEACIDQTSHSQVCFFSTTCQSKMIELYNFSSSHLPDSLHIVFSCRSRTLLSLIKPIMSWLLGITH